jgi:hypothetical protein
VAMNLAESAGVSACARAPETISALTAAEIIRVLSIMASNRVCSVKERKPSLFGNNSQEEPTFRACGTRGLMGNANGAGEVLGGEPSRVVTETALKGP